MEEIKQSELRPDSDYDKLIAEGVECSSCKEKLSNDEILMHKHVGIIEPGDMLCQKDWMRVAYLNGNKHDSK